jgi:hypothetical protein
MANIVQFPWEQREAIFNVIKFSDEVAEAEVMALQGQ